MALERTSSDALLPYHKHPDKTSSDLKRRPPHKLRKDFELRQESSISNRLDAHETSRPGVRSVRAAVFEREAAWSVSSGRMIRYVPLIIAAASFVALA